MPGLSRYAVFLSAGQAPGRRSKQRFNSSSDTGAYQTGRSCFRHAVAQLRVLCNGGRAHHGKRNRCGAFPALNRYRFHASCSAAIQRVVLFCGRVKPLMALISEGFSRAGDAKDGRDHWLAAFR